jgi:hypothetical protein
MYNHQKAKFINEKKKMKRPHGGNNRIFDNGRVVIYQLPLKKFNTVKLIN